MKPVTNENKKVKEFIQTVLINNIGDLVNTGNHFIGFGPQSQAIELIGAIIEDEAVERTQTVPESEFDTQRKSRRRFHNALKLFSNPNYIKYCPELKTDPTYRADYDLYANLRCGYAHQMKPTGKIAVTTEQEAIADGTVHMEIDPHTNNLIIASELLYKDLKEVCEKVIAMIDNGEINHPKAYAGFLGIKTYS